MGEHTEKNHDVRGGTNREIAKLVMDSWCIHYNFFRHHGGLEGKTPAEVARIEMPYKSWADVVKKIV